MTCDWCDTPLAPPVGRGHQHARFCCDAHRGAAWRERNRVGPTWKIVCDYLETHGPMTREQVAALIARRHPDLATLTVFRAVSRLATVGLIEVADRLASERFGKSVAVYRLADPGWLERRAL